MEGDYSTAQASIKGGTTALHRPGDPMRRETTALHRPGDPMRSETTALHRPA